MKRLDPIEELYDMYLEEEDSLRIVELGDMDLDFSLKNRPVDPFLELWHYFSTVWLRVSDGINWWVIEYLHIVI